MQVIKPQALGLSTRPIEYRKRFGLCVTAMLHVPFSQAQGGTLWGEQSAWNFLGQEMAAPLIDEGVAKLTSEFLVHGQAFVPADGRNSCAVRVRLGGRSKTLLVFGDRQWEGSQSSAPKAFASMPLDWAHAYGGAGHPSNPEGKGFASEKGMRLLPNIEHPDQVLHAPEQRVEPAGFGLLPPTHPQRTRYRGTYDENYTKEHAPGFAPDLDWRYFNLAPEDQWLDQPLRGDEPFQLDHLHPEKPIIEGRLPGLKARVFADYRQSGASEPRLREVPLRLTTVWFFPHAERALLLFQGLAEISTDDGSDVHGLLGAIERMGEPRSDAHYLNAIAQRNDPRWGAIQSLDDSDLLPEGIDAVDPETVRAATAFEGDNLQAEAQKRRAAIDVELAREEARARGQDPDALGIVMPVPEAKPAPNELVAHLKAQVLLAEAQQLEAIDDALTAMENAVAAQQKYSFDPLTMVHRGPPRFNADDELARLRASVPQANIDSDELHAKLWAKEISEHQGYLQTAHEQPPAHPMKAADAAVLREGMKKAIAGGLRTFAMMDFTGADFSGMDLHGVNFTGAWLESVDFTKANLSGANMSNAVLAHARFTDAIGIGTRLEGANLGRSSWAGAVFEGANFGKALLFHAALDRATLRRADMAGAQLLDTTWQGTDAQALSARDQVFYRRALTGMKFAEADMAGAQFIECDLSGADFRGAQLALATFVTCKLDGANLAGARAEGAMFVQGCSLVDIEIGKAILCNANFGASDMTRARAVSCVLDGANLCEVASPDSDWRLASAQGALLRRSVFARAQLAGVNFSNAILQHADLRSADMRRSNLFGADLARVRMDGGTRFDGALLKRSRTWPRLSVQEQEASA